MAPACTSQNVWEAVSIAGEEQRKGGGHCLSRGLRRRQAEPLCGGGRWGVQETSTNALGTLDVWGGAPSSKVGG